MKAFIPFQNFQKTDKLANILTVSYIVQTSEIGAYFHSDIRNYKEHKNKYKTVKRFVMHSFTYCNYQFLMDVDIKQEISNLTFQEKLDFIHAYDKLMKNINVVEKKDFFSKLKSKIKELLKTKDYDDKQYSEQQVNAFFNNFIKDIENKKKLLIKNLERLYTILTEYNANLS
jgi:flagellin-specific chaperone FliS